MTNGIDWLFADFCVFIVVIRFGVIGCCVTNHSFMFAIAKKYFEIFGIILRIYAALTYT
jgi:hypothetical protein